MDQDKSKNESGLNITQFFVGAPSNDEIREYFLRQKRLADIKALENSPETSPELSESFEMYLQQRKQKIQQEKSKMRREDQGFSDSPLSSKAETARNIQYQVHLNDSDVADNTLNRCDDDSFLAMEKMCEKTLHLNNESEILMDLTTMDSPAAQRKSLKKQSTVIDETRLNDIEAPSFLFNNSSLISPNKHSPVFEHHANRPSTILEVSETTNRTYQSSYRTAMNRSEPGTEASQYRTAEESLTFEGEGSMAKDNEPSMPTEIDDSMKIKMPKIRSFYADMTKDSLDVTKKEQETIDLTKDSLESSSGVDSSFDYKEDEAAGGEELNDTLDRVEYMLAQAQKIQEKKTPKINKTPVSKAFTPAPGSSSKFSPLIKFSPAARNSPTEPAFKKPTMSATKQPQLFSHSKKYQHIVSPISRYIKHTPGLPLATKVRVLPGIGNKSPKNYNFRDSESFAKENDSMNADQGAYGGSSLPFRAKTKSSAVSQVYDHRDAKKTPGGKQIQSLLTNSSPTVTHHQGHIKTRDTPAIFQNSLLDETALSEQSFADLSLFSGDVSVQVVEGAKRAMK